MHIGPVHVTARQLARVPFGLADDFVPQGGSRSKLFYEAMRIAREGAVGAIFCENVGGILATNMRGVFASVIKEIARSGYCMQAWRSLSIFNVGGTMAGPKKLHLGGPCV